MPNDPILRWEWEGGAVALEAEGRRENGTADEPRGAGDELDERRAADAS